MRPIKNVTPRKKAKQIMSGIKLLLRTYYNASIYQYTLYTNGLCFVTMTILHFGSIDQEQAESPSRGPRNNLEVTWKR